jgi:hypothetical protein
MVLLVLPLLAGMAVADKPGLVPTPVPFDGSNIQNGEAIPYGPPIVTNSPGEDVGDTYYAYQTNGSTGNRIAVDEFGGIHISFMKGTAEGGRPRYVYYNFKDENTEQWLGETAISSENGTGFVTMDLTDEGYALPAYHFADATPSYTAISIDLFRGFGIFEEFPIPNNDVEWIWPYVARNADGKIHVLNSDFNSDSYGYTRSEDGGQTWTGYAEAFSTDILSGIICTSPVSSKTAVVFTQANAYGGWDVFFFESTDGTDWNWRDPLNITEFSPADSMSAWADVDGIYDYDDNLHVLYQGLLSYDQGVYAVGDVMHWSEATGHSYVASSPENCATSNYNACIAKLSLGVDPVNTTNIIALWSELSDDDVSAAGFSNGELYAAGSVSSGAYWGPKVNLTNSPTPGCAPPDCDSDIYSSLAEDVDGYLHIMYVDDNDPGAEWNGEGVWTLNDVLYLEVDEYDVITTGVYDPDPDLPFEFALSQNYPNPFNANTVINVEGEFETGNLAIYDVTGRLVRDFAIDSENRSVTWDGADMAGEIVASGTYFYSVKVDGYGTAGVKKMTLLK